MYNINNRTLNYALVADENTTEFFFPAEAVYKNRDFVISKSGNELTFKNKDAQYTIYQTVKMGKIIEVGVWVTIKGKRYDLKGDIQSLKGHIHTNAISTLDNVYNE